MESDESAAWFVKRNVNTMKYCGDHYDCEIYVRRFDEKTLAEVREVLMIIYPTGYDTVYDLMLKSIKAELWECLRENAGYLASGTFGTHYIDDREVSIFVQYGLSSMTIAINKPGYVNPEKPMELNEAQDRRSHHRSQEILSARKIRAQLTGGLLMKNRIIALLMTAAVILALLPLSVSAASCKHSYGGAKWSEASHPHEYFYYCEKGCGSKQYTGTYMTKSNCAICNPSHLRKCQAYRKVRGPTVFTRIRRSALHAVRCFLMRRSRAARTVARTIEDITSTNQSISQADTTINICTATIAGKTSTMV